MLTLYDNPDSSNALKARILLAELGLDHRRVTIPLTESRPPDYREIQPSGLVPCLVDGDVVVRESNTILRYLADREERDDLYPRDPARRATVDTLMDAMSINLRPFLWEAERVVIYGERERGPWRADLARELSAWEGLLVGPEYGAGTFSIADCCAAGRLLHIDRLVTERDVWPRTFAMLESVRARPSYRAATVT